MVICVFAFALNCANCSFSFAEENLFETDAVRSTVQEELAAVIVEQPEEQTSERRVVIVWNETIDGIDEAVLILVDTQGKELIINESARTDKAILFKGSFDNDEFDIIGIRYSITGYDEEQYFSFEDAQLEAGFEVAEDAEILDENIITVASEDEDEIEENVEELVESVLSETKLASVDNNHIVVTLDPGHGGPDPGACYSGLKEKDLNLTIAKECKSELEEYGVTVYMTRTGDTNASSATTARGELIARAKVAKDTDSDLLVCIHNNASGNHNSKGVEIYYPYSTDYNGDAYYVGTNVSQDIIKQITALGLYNNGTKTRVITGSNWREYAYSDGSYGDYYGIIRYARQMGIPCVLVEHAYMDNSGDAAKLKDKSFLKKLGIADATGIANYFGLVKGGVELKPEDIYSGSDDDDIINADEKVDTFFEEVNFIRIAGQDRYETSMLAAEAYMTSNNTTKLENVVVASGEGFPDALSGGYLAKVKNATLILVGKGNEEVVATFIKENLKEDGMVYILGGTPSVSDEFESMIAGFGLNKKRLGGSDRYETNLLILKEAGTDFGDLLICAGFAFPDSLSASSAGRPILLTDGKMLNSNQKEYLKSLRMGTNYYIIGGTPSVSQNVYNQVSAILKGEHKRLGGKDRYETSKLVAEKFYQNGSGAVVFASGKAFPDGLTGSALARALGSPIILTNDNATKYAEDYIEGTDTIKAIALGGPEHISDETVNSIMYRNWNEAF